MPVELHLLPSAVQNDIVRKTKFSKEFECRVVSMDDNSIVLADDGRIFHLLSTNMIRKYHLQHLYLKRRVTKCCVP